MPKTTIKPIMISPIPAVGKAPSARPMSVKRASRMRLNWFVVGTVFGIAMSFFLQGIVGSLLPLGAPPSASPNRSLALREAPLYPPSGKPLTLAQAHGLPAPDATKKPEITTANAPSAPTLATAEPTPAYPLKLALKISKGASLLELLVANRVQTTEAKAVIAALPPGFTPQQLSVGQKISVTLERHEKLGDAAAVKELAIRLPNLTTLEMQRLNDGGFNVATREDASTQKSFRGVGKVRTSLFQAGADGRIPAAAMNELVKAFSYDVDFQREIHPGDTIEVLIDKKPNKDGKTYSGYGNLRYAALTLRGKKHEIYRHKNSDGDFGWYDAKGNSIKKSLLRTPLDAARITSGFGLRTHPIMGYTKMHKGVDFGAPTGTPIMAAGDGVVTFKGWKGGYGNFVTIKHNNTYETAYGHMSRFANIKVGQRVRQGDVIAYVGMTGMSTGPHLHYELRQNNAQVNPVSKQFNLAQGLSGKSLASFHANKATIRKELASLGGAPLTIADADTSSKATAKKAAPSTAASKAKSGKSATRSSSRPQAKRTGTRTATSAAKNRSASKSATNSANTKPLRVASR